MSIKETSRQKKLFYLQIYERELKYSSQLTYMIKIKDLPVLACSTFKCLPCSFMSIVVSCELAWSWHFLHCTQLNSVSDGWSLCRFNWRTTQSANEFTELCLRYGWHTTWITFWEKIHLLGAFFRQETRGNYLHTTDFWHRTIRSPSKYCKTGNSFTQYQDVCQRPLIL